LAGDLENDGYSAVAYHAGLDRNVREQRQEAFLKDEIKIIVATIAFGMGINKSNVRFVIHVDLPKNIEGYYQETGRAGRDGLHSEAVLFYGAGDLMKLKNFATIEGNEHQSRIMLKKLDKMAAFCEIKTCRRKYLLNYFGEEAADECAGCDVCLNKPVLADATVIAQKILSTVARLKERFGMLYMLDVLWGSNSLKIREEHKTLSVFGVGKDMPKEQWKYYVKELVLCGYLVHSNEEYPVLKLTEKSSGVLFKGEKVFLAQPVATKIVKELQIFQQHPYEKTLFDQLKHLRNSIAHEENVPAYIILSDSSLLDLATYLPIHTIDLNKISGFGEFKISKYGSRFLAVVQDYCKQNNLVTQIHLKTSKTSPARSAKPERSSETKQLTFVQFKQGKTLQEIAFERQLSTGTIESHLIYFLLIGQLQLDELVTLEKQKAIRDAVVKYGTTSLRLLKENLPLDITYGEIKMTISSTLLS
jgi:ATP-dependent DNA helicase RecQ